MSFREPQLPWALTRILHFWGKVGKAAKQLADARADALLSTEGMRAAVSSPAAGQRYRSRFSFPVGLFHPLQTCRFIPAHPVLDPAGLRRVGDSDPL
jgi:hypothetical protein